MEGGTPIEYLNISGGIGGMRYGGGLHVSGQAGLQVMVS